VHRKLIEGFADKLVVVSQPSGVSAAGRLTSCRRDAGWMPPTLPRKRLVPPGAQLGLWSFLWLEYVM
jgi:hypothetical protein